MDLKNETCTYAAYETPLQTEKHRLKLEGWKRYFMQMKMKKKAGLTILRQNRF